MLREDGRNLSPPALLLFLNAAWSRADESSHLRWRRMRTCHMYEFESGARRHERHVTSPRPPARAFQTTTPLKVGGGAWCTIQATWPSHLLRPDKRMITAPPSRRRSWRNWLWQPEIPCNTSLPPPPSSRNLWNTRTTIRKSPLAYWLERTPRLHKGK